jgi:hypothetical protein
MAMQRHGVPKAAVDCLFTTLQHATHQVRTGYGGSIEFYGGNYWLIPMHGIGQGNGAGPAIWAMVSTPILNMLRAKRLGCEIIGPISLKQHNFVGYTFVDDTDLIQTATAHSSQSAVTGLQLALDTWEGGLKASGGAIVPEKTFWYLVSFKWVGRNWMYQSIDDAPGSLYVNDIHGNRKLLRRLEPTQAEVTLGVALAPDGSMTQQTANMKSASIKWADAMRTGTIS